MLSLPNPYNDELCGSEQLFNSNSEPCEPCTPETLQVRWADIIDKPVCFPTCSPEVTGVTSLNGLAGNVTLGIGSTGTNFNIVSSSGTITLNLPIADATKTGKLSSIDWNTFNNKQNPITLTTTGNSGAATFIGNILNIPNYTLAGLGGVPGTGTINYLAKWTFTTTTALTNSIVYDNGTQVGIGTFAPTALLDVVTASTITSSIKARNSNGATILSNTSAIGSLSTDWNAPLAFSTNSVEHMRILTNGNVGIGTTNPTSTFDVVGTASISSNLNVNSGTLFVDASTSRVGIGTTTPTVKLQLGDGITDQRALFRGLNLYVLGIANTSSDIYYLGTTTSSTPDLVFSNSAPSEKMRLTYDGQLSIGTNSPSASAILQADSTTKGFLPPRMTTTQINAITTPATGLVVYNTTNDHLCVYQGPVDGWVKLSHTPM